MAYDSSKLINLGQLKSALLAIKQSILGLKSVRTVVTVHPSGWSAYDSNSYRYSNVFSAEPYTYYDMHLTEDTSNVVGTMCANADIHARLQNGVINLYCYGTLPTELFTVEIIAVPITTSGVGISYDFGDDYMVYKSITDTLDNKISTLETDVPKMIIFTRNVAITTSRWVSSGDVDFPYKAVINVPEITDEYLPIVQFEDTDVAVYDFSPNAVTATGTVTIYCKTRPNTAIIVPNIAFYKGKLVQSS